MRPVWLNNAAKAAPCPKGLEVPMRTVKEIVKAIAAAKTYYKEVILFISSPARILEISRLRNEMEFLITGDDYLKFFEENPWLESFMD